MSLNLGEAVFFSQGHPQRGLTAVGCLEGHLVLHSLKGTPSIGVPGIERSNDCPKVTQLSRGLGLMLYTASQGIHVFRILPDIK